LHATYSVLAHYSSVETRHICSRTDRFYTSSVGGFNLKERLHF